MSLTWIDDWWTFSFFLSFSILFSYCVSVNGWAYTGFCFCFEIFSPFSEMEQDRRKKGRSETPTEKNEPASDFCFLHSLRFFMIWFFFLFWPFRKLKKNSLPICRILESIQCILYENIHSIYRMECILRFVCWYHDDDTNFNYSPIITSIITYNKHMHVIIKHIFSSTTSKMIDLFFSFPPLKTPNLFFRPLTVLIVHWFFVCLLYVLII